MYYLLLIASGMLIFSSCDDSFDPIQENDKYFFSIFAFLDVSADTQWVRVAPARRQIDAPPEVPEMLVTLEHLESGETAVMKDSLFGAGSGFNYINFYTGMGIEPNQTYRLKAERPDGTSSHVSVSTPGNFPTPIFFQELSSTIERQIYQIILKTENIVDVQTWWFVRITSDDGVVEKKFTFPYADRLQWVKAYEGAYVAEFVYQDEVGTVMNSPIIRNSPNPEVEILHRQIYVAKGGPEWDDTISGIDDIEYFVDGTASNVVNGLGYMVGVYSKVVPYDTCKDDSGWIMACEEEDPFW